MRGSLGLFVLVVTFSCTQNPSGPRSDDQSLQVHLSDENGDTPTRYSVRHTPKTAGTTGTAVSACCDGMQCSQTSIVGGANGFTVKNAADSLVLVLKAAGYRALRTEVSRSPAEKGPLRLHLQKLDGFQVNPDYATGFPAAGGRDLFTAMAVRSPGEGGATYTLKFLIDNSDTLPKVYFQNTVKHPLHYNFARDVLGLPLSLSEFEAKTYRGPDRPFLAGTLVWRADSKFGEDANAQTIQSPITLEFFPSDDLTPDQALAAGLLIEERVLFPDYCGKENRIHYLPPTTSHEAALQGAASRFAESDMPWLLRETLFRGLHLQLLNMGEAYGTLRLLPPENLITAPVSFRDIVILTRLPNEMPLVGGTITEELQTPLSHVNVAARGRNTPNIALPGASTQSRLTGLLDSLVHFKVMADTFVLEKATREEAEAFWKSLKPRTPDLPASDLKSVELLPFARLNFADRDQIGVKAANLAELSRLLGSRAPIGFAVPFAHYAAFLDSGKITQTLCAEAEQDCVQEARGAESCSEASTYRRRFCDGQNRLKTFIDSLLDSPRFQNDSRFREASLDGLRYLMRHIPVDSAFARTLDAMADSLFRGKRVRLRSSTNAEDLEDFNGAGLYSSTGADASGPERPSDEIRKVWASTWNWQAFEERSFRGIDHRQVNMGVVVHPSFAAEKVNGVLITRNLADPAIDGFYVNVQPGEISVTNPTDGSLPEIFTIAGAGVIRQRHSSHSPDSAVMSDGEIAELGKTANQIVRHFAGLYGKDARDPLFALELEFKLDNPDRALFIKQVRPFPIPR